MNETIYKYVLHFSYGITVMHIAARIDMMTIVKRRPKLSIKNMAKIKPGNSPKAVQINRK